VKEAAGVEAQMAAASACNLDGWKRCVGDGNGFKIAASAAAAAANAANAAAPHRNGVR